MAEDQNVHPNKSGKKPSKPLDTAPGNEMSMDGKRNTEIVTAQLKLKNDSKNKVAYKVICNHPFVLAVDKDIGFIESGSTATIVVTRQRFDSDKYDNQGRRTVLLVQHVSVSHKADDARKIWAYVIGSCAMKKRIPVKLLGSDNRILGDTIKEEDNSKTED